MELNKFYYYGAFVPTSEVTSHMVQFGKKDMYSFVAENGLQYRKCGLITTTYRIVIGRELAVNDLSFEVDLSQNNIVEVLDADKITFKLTAAEEQKVREALLLVGVYFEPKYYAFINWGV